MVDGSAMSSFDMAEFDCAILQLDGWDGTMPRFEANLSRTLGGPLPEKVGEAVRLADSLAIRIAPRRFWLLRDGTPPAVDIDPELGCSLRLGEGWIRLRLTGTGIRHVLERCVAVDWDALAPGQAVQTGFHRVPVLLVRKAEFECDLLVPRSFARSLAEAVADASAAVR